MGSTLKQSMSLEVLSILLEFRSRTEQKNPPSSIIALHGLDGHPYGSWKSKGNLQHMWLRDSFVKHFPTCRTLIYGYDSNLKTRGHHSLSDFTVQLLDRLMSLRKTEEVSERVVILLCVIDELIEFPTTGETTPHYLDCSQLWRTIVKTGEFEGVSYTIYAMRFLFP